MKLYTHRHLRKTECKVLFPLVLLLITVIIVAALISLWYAAKNHGLDWYCVLCGIFCFLSLFWILDAAYKFYGDRIEKGKIICYKFFKKRIIDISEIKVIIISARWGGYLGASGTMRKGDSSKKSMPCISVLREIDDYKSRYFYMHNIKDSEGKNFLYSFNATDDILLEFFKNKFQGEIYVLDRIYHENKEFFDKAEVSLKEGQFTVYHADAPAKESFYG